MLPRLMCQVFAMSANYMHQLIAHFYCLSVCVSEIDMTIWSAPHRMDTNYLLDSGVEMSWVTNGYRCMGVKLSGKVLSLRTKSYVCMGKTNDCM